MVDAVKKYDAEHADVEVIYGQGKSGTDDEGEIAIIENMIVQQVKAIAITPTSPNVQAALDKAVKAGIKVVLIDNDIPGWTGKSSVVATDNLAGGKLAGAVAGQEAPGRRQDRHPAGAAGQPVARRPGQGHEGDARRRPRSVVAEPATDCDQTKGLNAAQDLLTAHPDVTAIYGACGPPIIGALQAIKAAGKKPGEIVVVGFDAAPDELDRHQGRRRGRLGRPVPRQDGLAGHRDRRQGRPRRDRPGQRRHRHRDGDQGQRRPVLVAIVLITLHIGRPGL